jgi:hypothetical protein
MDALSCLQFMSHHALLDWSQAMQLRGWIFLAQKRLLFSCCPWVPPHPHSGSAVWKVGVKSTLKRSHFRNAGMTAYRDQGETWMEDVLLYILSTTFQIVNTTWLHNDLSFASSHILNMTCICDHHWWSTVMTFEMVIGSQCYGWHSGSWDSSEKNRISGMRGPKRQGLWRLNTYSKEPRPCE